MGDPNPQVAYALAAGLGPAKALPESISHVEQRAALADAVGRPFAGEVFGGELLPLLAAVGRAIGESVSQLIVTSAKYMPDVSDPIERLNITLRLWAGCISAAKTIAHGTRSGPNTPEARERTFVSIDGVAREDAIFAAGVEAAPFFLRLRAQDYSLDGVPDKSRVRRYLR